MAEFSQELLINLIKEELPKEGALTSDEIISKMKVIDTGIDSLSLFELLSNLEEEYNIEIPERVINAEITINELFEEIKKLIN
tara:strand:+ start:590 stop:838 length:249 start_codon:yes stop_codon:yes gene_type:complete